MPLWVDRLFLVKANSTHRIFSPAKVNLMLSVTGKRKDGFHELVSLVVPLTFGDYLTIERIENSTDRILTCSDSSVPVGEGNLVLQAAEKFLAEMGNPCGLEIHLEKHIPMEAGLGGGSSNVASTLLGLNRMFENALSHEQLASLATEIGSDCPLFLDRGPVIIRGRGERVEALVQGEAARLAGLKIALFRPNLGISTPWAYRQLAKRPELYEDAQLAEDRLNRWKFGELSLPELLFNSFEKPVFAKYLAFPALFQSIEEKLNLHCLLSGSGSCCFAMLPDSQDEDALKALVREAFGSEEGFFHTCEVLVALGEIG
ncbi:MAG: 4-(cytidine 5'-diphospho)-2-C-methyl-D-erythritol kinase [Opitutaceae bacterium]|nr:4-(cytidine 5'-diphospho)-2-C-methyl-D-erythritol kinase [Opitutaceae bacterium]